MWVRERMFPFYVIHPSHCLQNLSKRLQINANMLTSVVTLMLGTCLQAG